MSFVAVADAIWNICSVALLTQSGRFQISVWTTICFIVHSCLDLGWVADPSSKSFMHPLSHSCSLSPSVSLGAWLPVCSEVMSSILVCTITISFAPSPMGLSWTVFYYLQPNESLFSCNLKHKNIPYLSWNKNLNGYSWERCNRGAQFSSLITTHTL